MREFLVFLLVLIHYSDGSLSNLCLDIYPNDAKNIFLHLVDAHWEHNLEKYYCEDFSKDELTDILQMQITIKKMSENSPESAKFVVLFCDACSDDVPFE